MQSALFVSVIFFLSAFHAFAVQSWDVPCVHGLCTYDKILPDGTKVATLKIWGAPDAISDITPAAGWHILDCNPDETKQDILLICLDNNAECNHIINSGARDIIVRLPQSCKMPFARVVRWWTPEDQSFPISIQGNLVTGADRPTVFACRLDTDFAKIDPNKGVVSFSVQGSTSGLAQDNSTVTQSSLHSIMLSKRDPHTIADSIFSGKHHRLSSNSTAGAFRSALFNPHFNKTFGGQLPIDVDKSFEIFNREISCPANQFVPADFTASVNVGVQAKAHALVDVKLVAAGTIHPANLSNLAIIAGLDFDLDSTLDVFADVGGDFDSGPIPLLEIALPGFEIAGLFTVGPSLKLNAQLTAGFELSLDMKVDLAYSIKNGVLVFPPDQGDSHGDFSPADTNFSLSTSETLQGDVKVAAHIIPSLEFGIEFFRDILSATVFLDLDTFAELELTGTAQADQGASPASASAQACVDLSTGFAVNAGARGSFPGLFDDSTHVTLFNKDFELFKKCIGAGTDNATDNTSVIKAGTTIFLNPPASTQVATQATVDSNPAVVGGSVRKRAPLSCLNDGPPTSLLGSATVKASDRKPKN